MKKYDKIECPKCKNTFEDPREMRCDACGFVPDSRDKMWKAANMGKQLGKPKANRDGKNRR